MNDEDLTPTDPLAGLRAREALREAEAELDRQPPLEVCSAAQPTSPSATPDVNGHKPTPQDTPEAARP